MLSRPVLDVAPALLGGILRKGDVAVRITEVEAYDGPADPGSHAHRGPTLRNQVMFGPPGRLYVYLTYGMHHCCNVVCGPEGRASAVLVRGGEVVEGLDIGRLRRPNSSERDLCRGPARLCRTLGIDLSDNTADLAGGTVALTLPATRATRIGTGPRVGLRLASDRPWRFWIEGEPTVSAYRPAKPR